jgi:hypothetical protein
MRRALALAVLIALICSFSAGMAGAAPNAPVALTGVLDGLAEALVFYDAVWMSAARAFSAVWSYAEQPGTLFL